MISTRDLGCKTNIEIIAQFVALENRFVVDAGCGDLGFTRQLSDLGARVLAIDPDPIQAERNRSSDLPANVEFIEAGAGKIPAEDQSVDGVFVSYSLHHIPAEIYPQVFAEVLRVLKPVGFLYVIEPTDCLLNDVMKLFHDEEIVRAAAQQALLELAVPLFKTVDVVTYHSFRQFESYEDFVRHFSSRTFNTIYSEADVRQPEVRAAFERLGRPDYRFQAPKQVMCLQGVKTTPSSLRLSSEDLSNAGDRQRFELEDH